MRLIFLACCWLVSGWVWGSDVQVNINTADAAQLSALLVGVGEKKAQALIAWRQEHGALRNLNDLAQVKGFGPKLIARNKDRIRFQDTVGQQPTDKHQPVSSLPSRSLPNRSLELHWPAP